MSSWQTVMQGLRSQIIGATSGLVQEQNISIGYPATFIMQTAGQTGTVQAQLPQDGTPLIALYDRNISQDVTRWLPRYITPWSMQPLGAMISSPQANSATSTEYGAQVLEGTSSGPFTLDFSGTIETGTAFGLWIKSANEERVVTYVASGTMPLPSFASGVTSALVSGGVSATSSGGSVFVDSGSAARFTAALGSLSSAAYEVHRVRRSLQVITMANRPSTLDLVTEPLSQLFSKLEVSYGYETPDNQWVRLINKGDIVLWDNVQRNIARRDFVLSLEYSVSIQEEGYAVLAAMLAEQINYG